jgi:hypothetical protein
MHVNVFLPYIFVLRSGIRGGARKSPRAFDYDRFWVNKKFFPHLVNRVKCAPASEYFPKAVTTAGVGNTDLPVFASAFGGRGTAFT